MQAGAPLSCALDPPGRLSTLVHTATVTSLPSGHRCLSGTLHSAAAALLSTVPLAASCRLRGHGRRDTVAVFVAASTTSSPVQSRPFLSLCGPFELSWESPLPRYAVPYK